MQPGYPGSGQDPYGQPQPPYSDPYAQPQYPPPQQPPAYQDPYAQPQPPAYQDPYAPQQPTSGSPYPTSGNPYPASPPAYPAYPAGGYGAPAPAGSGQNNVFGILALVLGIVSIPLACCWGIGLLPGGAAAVLGYLGMKKFDQGEGGSRGLSLAGLICGGVGAALSVALFVLFVVLRVSNPYS
jgi:hypothetical protein